MLPTYLPPGEYQNSSKTIGGKGNLFSVNENLQITDGIYSNENLFSQSSRKYQPTNSFSLLEEHILHTQEPIDNLQPFEDPYFSKNQIETNFDYNSTLNNSSPPLVSNKYTHSNLIYHEGTYVQ
ncbi:hypothetical protein LOD99_10975 [Oopsacas minuta]|uniref:Uncharacterized protein n=1 Tax=Oopsacas minuta TaxID=111878 RepID=A0AAV7KB99_9METZ|nr:hypothetical protein LOD99_10975 [Oopsacas minuta]